MKSFLIALISIFILSGCSTKYQQKSFTGGFSETQLSENSFIVHFKGNAFTSKEKATDFTLLRSAELAINNGFKYFTVINDEYNERIHVISNPSTATTNYSAITTNGITHGVSTTKYNKGTSSRLVKPRTSSEIICYKVKPNITNIVYEASYLKKSIEQKYNIK